MLHPHGTGMGAVLLLLRGAEWDRDGSGVVALGPDAGDALGFCFPDLRSLSGADRE